MGFCPLPLGFAPTAHCRAMIHLPLPWLVFTALFIFLAGILVVWVGYEISRRRREAHALRHWTSCRICSYKFRTDGPGELPRCPQCGAPNTREPLRIF